jgi:hypothetical protein
VATLTYDYRGQAAWLDRLSPEAHPMTHDLCDQHAESLSVPQGWRLEDRRMIVPISQPASPASHVAPAEDAPVEQPVGLFHSQLAG